jgi:hypothetical protein
MKVSFCSVSVTCLLLMTGCSLDGPVPSSPKRETPEASKQTDPNAGKAAERENTNSSDRNAGRRPAGNVNSSEPSTAGTTSPENSTPATPPGRSREKAAVGMGEKGRGYGGGVITMPIKAFFNARDNINLLHMRDALNKFKAFEGHWPKTQKEFDEKIIKENGIQLPGLPPEHRYVYDPEQGELLVERPDNL